MSEKSVYPRVSDKRYKIAIIEGPNQTNQGNRSKKVYGKLGSLDELLKLQADAGERFGVEIVPFVSNFEGEILKFIHESASEVDAYIVNPAGLTQFGIPTLHALYETHRPFVELHMANIEAQPTHPRGIPIGPWKSAFTPHAHGLFMGLREYTYVGTLLSLVLALDDEDFFGAPEWRA